MQLSNTSKVGSNASKGTCNSSHMAGVKGTAQQIASTESGADDTKKYSQSQGNLGLLGVDDHKGEGHETANSVEKSNNYCSEVDTLHDVVLN